MANEKMENLKELIGENTAISERYDKSTNNETFFVKIPASFFDCGLVGDFKYILLVYATLFRKKDMANIISNISLKDIIEDNGLVPTKGKGRNIEQFKNALFQLMYEGYLKFHNEDLSHTLIKALKDPNYTKGAREIKTALTLKTDLSLVFNKKHYDSKIKNSFLILNYRILRWMKEDCFNQTKVKLQNVLNIYLLIKRNVYMNNNSVCFIPLSYSYISNKLKLSKKTIADTFNFLEENDYIKRTKRRDYSIKYELIHEDINGVME